MAIRKMDNRTNDGDKTLYTIEQQEPHSYSWMNSYSPENRQKCERITCFSMIYWKQYVLW